MVLKSSISIIFTRLNFNMKKILTLFITCITSLSYSQVWMRELEARNPNPNFFEIREAFEEYAEGKIGRALEGLDPEEFEKYEREIPGYEQFKRFEYFWETRIDENGNFPAPDAYWKAFLEQQSQAKNNETDTMDHGNWSLIGPSFNIPSSGGGMGRINVVRYDPQNPSIVWAGAPAGGLWKSIDGGTTWLPTTTDKLPSIAISDIAIHPTNSNIMFIATGDEPGTGSDPNSIGLLKSVDGGVTWTSSALSYFLSAGRKISQIRFNPLHPDTMLVATNNGLLTSSDGGTSWTLAKSGVFKDVELNPANPDIVYICTSSAIYKSTDAGFTFGASTIATGFPSGISRIELEVTPANPNVIYALCADNNDGYKALMKTSDGALTWQMQSSAPNLLGWAYDGSDSGGQAFYTLTLAVSPVNEDILLVGGVNIWRSTNGGNTFQASAHWFGQNGIPYVHADIHYITFKPVASGATTASTILVGCDGGVFKSTNTGQTWTDLSKGLQIMQLYRMSQSMSNPAIIIAGAQDNGTNLFTGSVVDKVQGGDGMDCQISPFDDNIMFASLPNGSINKSIDGGNSFYDVTPTNQDGQGKWVTPFTMSKSNPDLMYIGYKDIYRSTGLGEQASWVKVTTNLSGGQTYQYIAVAPSDDNTVYACTNGKLYKSIDGGTTWAAKYTVTSGSSITYITVSDENPDVVFLTISNFGTALKVMKTRDGGATWTNISKTGLPAVPINCSAYQMNNYERIYVGTDLGVYYTDTTLSKWYSFNINLPNTIVSDLDFSYASKKLRASTYGRGIWETPYIITDVTGVEDLDAKIEFNVYPNPANNLITVHHQMSTFSKLNYELFDVLGNITIEGAMTNDYTKIDVSNLHDGVYFLKVKNGKNSSIKKFVISN